MKMIAVTSQNFRTITGHAGKARRFLVFRDEGGSAVEVSRLDLPKEMSMHEFRGDEHPLQAMDVIITGGCGEGFVRRMQSYAVEVLTTSATDPQQTVQAYIQGLPLPAALPHDHSHEGGQGGVIPLA